MTLLFALALCLPVLALTGRNVEKTCPYDGTKFQFNEQMSGTSVDQGLDFMLLGAIISPHPIASCPTNGFVFLKEDYSDEELERLRPLICSAEFQALKEEMPYYRAAWITERTGGTHADVSWLLLQATWETGRVESYKSYVEVLIKRLPEDSERKSTYQSLYAELLRRAGRFEGSERYKRYAEELIKRLPEDFASAEGERKFTFQLLYAELLRRVGRFEESVGFLTQLAAQAPVRWAALVAYEKDLAMRRDHAPHFTSEAQKGDVRPH
jgi:hypothetical protein